jgi:hypothetical protein
LFELITGTCAAIGNIPIEITNKTFFNIFHPFVLYAIETCLMVMNIEAFFYSGYK